MNANKGTWWLLVGIVLAGCDSVPAQDWSPPPLDQQPGFPIAIRPVMFICDESGRCRADAESDEGPTADSTTDPTAGAIYARCVRNEQEAKAAGFDLEGLPMCLSVDEHGDAVDLSAGWWLDGYDAGQRAAVDEVLEVLARAADPTGHVCLDVSDLYGPPWPTP